MKSKMLLSVYVVALMIIFSGCSKEPRSVIKDFYDAKTWEERKAFILDPVGLKQEDLYPEGTTFTILEITLDKKIDDSSTIYKVKRKVTLLGKEIEQVKKVLVVNVGGKEKIDVKTALSYNDVDIKQFCQSEESGPKDFWVKVNFEKSHYFMGSNTECLFLSDASSERITVPISTTNLPSDIAKLKEIAIKDRESSVLVRITSKAEITRYGAYYVKQENVKFLKINPLSDN